MTSNHRDRDQEHQAAVGMSSTAGAYLRARWRRWILRGGDSEADALMPAPLGLVAHRRHTEGGTEASPTPGASNARPDASASRNAQNCTFEVF